MKISSLWNCKFTGSKISTFSQVQINKLNPQDFDGKKTSNAHLNCGQKSSHECDTAYSDFINLVV